MHFVSVLRKQRSNIGHTKTTGKIFRNEVLEVGTRVDAMIKSSQSNSAIGKEP